MWLYNENILAEPDLKIRDIMEPHKHHALLNITHTYLYLLPYRQVYTHIKSNHIIYVSNSNDNGDSNMSNLVNNATTWFNIGGPSQSMSALLNLKEDSAQAFI